MKESDPRTTKPSIRKSKKSFFWSQWYRKYKTNIIEGREKLLLVAIVKKTNKEGEKRRR